MHTTGGQLTPSQVAAQLAALARELDEGVRAIEQADRDRVQKRAEYDLAYAKAFLNAEGPIDVRRYTAVEATHQLRVEADAADGGCVAAGE